MAGLLDYLNTPEGVGLLSMVAGGMTGARRGTPVNNIGRGVASGLMGYQGAQALDVQNKKSAVEEQYRALQLGQLQRQNEQQKVTDTWNAGLPAMMQQKMTGTTDQGKQLAEQQNAFGQDGAQSLVDASQYAKPDAPLNMNYGMDKQALQNYMLQPGSPYQKQFLENMVLPKAPIKLGADEKLLDPTTYAQLASGGGKADVKDGYLVPDGNGGFKIDPVMYEAALGLKQKVARAGAPNMTAINNIKSFEPFQNKVQGNMGEVLVKNFETLQNIPQTLQALDSAKTNLSKAGNFVGSGAETKLAVAKFFNNNLGTNIDPTGVKNTEALQSALFYNVMDNLKKMDASPSQQQQKVMQDAFGRITTDPAALPMIIDFYKKQVVSKANEHNRRVDETMSGPSGMQFPYDIHVKVPAQENAKPPGNDQKPLVEGQVGRSKSGRATVVRNGVLEYK